MKMEKLPKTGEQELSAEKQADLFNAIVRGEDCTEVIKTTRGDFKIKYPRVADIEAIGRLAAARQNELPATSFDNGILSLIQKVALLDILTVEGPGWYENAKAELTSGSVWQNIPLQSFIDEVYSKTLEFRNKVQTMLEKGRKATDKRVAPDASTTDGDSATS